MSLRQVVLGIATLTLVGTMVAQPVAVTVNGIPNGASFVSGSLLSWSIALPAGAVSNNGLWVDVNENGRVDAGTDRLLFQFQQQDGVSVANGPADDDGMANGTISTQFTAGLAPAKWLLVASSGPSADTASFTVLPLSSPTATITGHVTVPVGVDRSFILIQAEPVSGGGPMSPFWHGLTDSTGTYAIHMGGEPAMMGPWRVRIETQQLGRLVALRPDSALYVGATDPVPVLDFQLVFGTILTGLVVDQAMSPLPGAYPHVHPSANPQGEGNLGGETDLNGRFSFAVPPGTWLLHFTKDGYHDQWWNAKTSSMSADVITVTTQDTIGNLNGSVTKAGEIRGTVRNYGQPTEATVSLFTMPGEMVIDSRQTGGDGSYSFAVDPGTYYVKFEKGGMVQYWNHTSSSPGDPVTITGSETITNIDGDLSVGLHPSFQGPQILRVWDVPFDNGKQAYVKFRGVEQNVFGPNYSNGPMGIEKYTIWRLDKSGLVYAGTIPAALDSVYIGIVPTIVDSSIADGMRWSRFIVKAHFLFNMYVIPSQIDSGYSLDNLAPNVPGGVGSAVAGNDVRILWDRNPDDDLRYYSIYRGTTENFSVSGLLPVSRTTEATFTDVGAATGTYYYRITATDFAGNESAPSRPVSSTGTTAVRSEGVVPSVFALGHNYPNPFNPSTSISFDVPSTANVRIEVYNTLGQLVAELLNGEVTPGRHTVSFDASGLPSGLYMVRMQSGEFMATRKMNLVK